MPDTSGPPINPHDNPNINPGGGQQHFDPLDTNHDGTVDFGEYIAGGGGNNPPGGGGGGDTGGGSSGGGSSGGSSGGGSSFDPDDALIAQARSAYFQLWGQYPPSGYIEKLVHSGMNIWEIQDHERHKPAFRKTKAYYEQASTNAGTINGILGR